MIEMTTKKRKKNNPTNISKTTKEEPNFEGIVTVDDLLSAIKYYNEFADTSKSKTWLIEYMKIEKYDNGDIEKVKSFSWNKSGLEIDNGEIVSLKFAGYVSRMYLRGLTEIPEQYQTRLNTAIDYCLKKGKVKTKNHDDDTNKISIQNHIDIQVSNLCAELEGEVDDFYDNGFKTNLNMYDWLRTREIKGLIAKRIGDNFRPLLQEMEDITKDDDLKEAYRHFKRSDIKKYKGFLKNIIDDCERYSSNQNTNRKPRKKKPITNEKLVSKLIFKKEDIDYKIKSIDPVKIINSSVLWVFNVKYRKLGYYVSEKPAGLSVKGSTIIGFDNQKSYQKVIRKPEEVLGDILNGSNASIRKKIESINSKEQPLNGRINRETVLLKIIK